ncbi:MAG: hypothetical protein D4R81_07190 [Nitrospiraceae bacterium]|nr:MAG: hypothetical protein D4R81_07190 [Nitrospiraceae bacterium]
MKFIDMAATLLFFLRVVPILLASSCASLSAVIPSDSSEVISSLREPVVAKALEGAKIGYLEFVPLPQNYPPEYFPHERVFTDEVFSKDPTVALPSPDLLFVPKDYPSILDSSFSRAAGFSKLTFKKYTSVREATSDGCDLLIVGAPLAFHVEDESKAVIKIFYKVYSPANQKTVWEGYIENQFLHTAIPRSISDKALIFLVGSHEFNFQPQRVLLAAAVYNNTMELLLELRNIKWGIR